MRETLELRVVEREASRLFRPDEGSVLPGGHIRRVLLPLDDPRLPRVGAFDRELSKKDRAFFFGWTIHRRYSERELREAELLRLWPRATFEPAGEECGTQYDESRACPHCGAGARQASELVLDLKCVPKGADLARTIANEIIVSTRLVEAMQARGITGAEFRPVRQSGKKGAVSSGWHQLAVVSPPVDVVAPTVTGNDPFDLDEQDECRCPLGHIAGLNLLSELHIARKSHDGSDWACTRQLFSMRMGLIRPHPLLLISPKLRALFVELKVKRLLIEVAHPL